MTVEEMVLLFLREASGSDPVKLSRCMYAYARSSVSDDPSTDSSRADSVVILLYRMFKLEACS
jgi:hypothetical protein